VSWTVIAVVIEIGCQYILASVNISACSPAPPVGSVAEKVITFGGDNKCLII